MAHRLDQIMCASGQPQLSGLSIPLEVGDTRPEPQECERALSWTAPRPARRRRLRDAWNGATATLALAQLASRCLPRYCVIGAGGVPLAGIWVSPTISNEDEARH
jgi:hypothetical protein